MIISNVNIGSYPGANDGESIYSAFYKVNQNFANVKSNINALTNSVSSVAGRTGNVTLTIADVVGLATTYASQANIITANTLMKGYVDGQISAANSAPNTANIGMLGYVNLANTIQSSIITVSNSSMKNYVDGQISAANSAPNTANIGMQGYVDNKVSTANIGMLGYVNNQVTAANTAANSANLGLKGYVDNAVTTSNIGIIGHIALANTIQSQQITAANLGIIGYVDNKVSTANIGVIGYIDRANTIQSEIITASNIGIIGYIGLGNTIVTAGITTANLGMIGYVDNKVSTANVGIIGYIGNQVNAANVAWQANALAQSVLINSLNTAFVNLAANAEIQQGNIFSLETSIASVNSSISLGNTIQSEQITAANLGIIGYIGNQVSTANIGIKGYIDLANTIQQERITAGNVGIIGYIGLGNTIVTAGITSANLGMIGYVDNKVSTANIGIIGYVDNKVSTANIGIIGYVDNKVSTANIGIIGYIGLGNTIQSAQITSANIGMKGYVDNQTYSNVQVATFLPTYTGNVGNITVDGNINLQNNSPYINFSSLGISLFKDVNNGQGLHVVLPGHGLSGNIRVRALRVENDITWVGNNVSVITTILNGITAANLGLKGYVDSVSPNAGVTNQGDRALAVGRFAGASNQGSLAVAIGAGTGYLNQSANAVAIGSSTGYENQGFGAVAIGRSAGGYFQGNYAVSVGYHGNSIVNGTQEYQGEYAISIGYKAGLSSQPSKSIIVNANDEPLNATANIAGLYINPVRLDSTSSTGNIMYYNTSTKEIIYRSILISNPNYITVSNNWVYTLSSTVSDNILLVTSTGLFATINMPVGAVDGQVVTFSANAKLTITAGTGTVQPTFTGANILVSTFRYIYRSSANIWYRN